MRILTRTTKILQLDGSEIDALSDMVREAGEKGSAERGMTPTQSLRIEVVERSDQPRGWRYTAAKSAS